VLVASEGLELLTDHELRALAAVLLVPFIEAAQHDRAIR
jgi:hypothetical protein